MWCGIEGTGLPSVVKVLIQRTFFYDSVCFCLLSFRLLFAALNIFGLYLLVFDS